MASFKIALIGYNGVGKSCFLERFQSGNFGAAKVKHLQTKFSTSEGKIELEVVANPDKIDDTYDGTIVMFSFADRISYSYTVGALEGFKIGGYKKPILVIGNQYDLREKDIHMHKGITDKGYTCVECSAKSLYNYEKPFLYVFRKLTGVEDLKFVASE